MSEEICEIIPSNKGGDKLNVRGFLMTKERIREDTYYWSCDKKKSNGCKGRAVTKLVKNEHKLHKFTGHDHGPEASKPEVAKAIHKIKQQARDTRDKLAKIVQESIISTPEEICPYLPSLSALRQTIYRVRQSELSSQTQDILELDIPESLQYTLNNNLFLIGDQIGRDDIPTAFNFLKSQMPAETNNLVKWFEETYALSRIQRGTRSGNE
ncbi:8557_t:CDS:2, partial [Scutellospora calospora]